MFDDRSKKFHNQYVNLDPINVEAYVPFVGPRAISELQWLAEPLAEKVWPSKLLMVHVPV